MNPHDERHDDWLAARLGGEPVPPEWERVLDECTECRDALSELHGLEDELARAARHERAVVARVATEAPTASAASSAPVASSRAARSVASGSLALRAAAVFVLCAAVGFLWRSLQESSGPTDPGPRLGSTSITNLSPTGAVREIREFGFTATLPSGGSFRIRVYDLAAGEELVVESPPLLEPRWTVDATTLAKLPRRFRWQVRVIDATDLARDGASADVEWPGR